MSKIRMSIFYKFFVVFLIAAGVAAGIVEYCEDVILKTTSPVLFGVIVAFILLLVFLLVAIRTLLAPLKALEQGVKELTSGNLDYVVATDSRDELGRIVRSFNQMSQQLRTIIRSKEQLLLDVSHEFRSPLTRIKIALEVDGDERESIKRSIREIETMIAEILESARMDDKRGGLKREETDLFQIISEIVSHYKDAQLGIHLKMSSQPWMVMVDPVRLRMAIQNLIENAVKYSSHQSRPVEVTAEPFERSHARILIRDFGVGIPEEDQPFIFEPFFRVDRSRTRSTGGYGLGLSLTKKIVLAHGGKIEVKSHPGQETLFTVEFPCV